MNEEKGNFPYKHKKCYVFTNSKQQPNNHVEFINGKLPNILEQLKDSGRENIWLVGGGNLISHFVKENLVDEYMITIAPTILGKGIPLFDNLDCEIELELKSMRRFNQFAQLNYVKKS